jgi:hypothetical protein
MDNHIEPSLSGIAQSFALAVAVALITQAIALALTRRGWGPSRRLDPATQPESGY